MEGEEVTVPSYFCHWSICTLQQCTSILDTKSPIANAFQFGNPNRLLGSQFRDSNETTTQQVARPESHSPTSPENSLGSNEEEDLSSELGGEDGKKGSKSQRNRTAYTVEQIESLEKGIITTDLTAFSASI